MGKECRTRERGPTIRYGLSSEEVPLHRSQWIRQIHRWQAIAFTVAVIVNIVAVGTGKYTSLLGLGAVIGLAWTFSSFHQSAPISSWALKASPSARALQISISAARLGKSLSPRPR